MVDFETYEDYELISRRNSDNTNSRFVYATQDELEDPNSKDLFNFPRFFESFCTSVFFN